MKFFTCLVLINLGAAEFFAQNYWIQQSSPTSKGLFKCFFTDSLYGWAVGDSGVIVHTTNSGDNWNIQASGIFSSKLEDVFFLDRNLGWIVCIDSTFKTRVLSTTNGGSTWAQSFFPDTTVSFSTISFINASTGFISGFTGKIFKTTNNGTGWFECGYDTTGCLYLFPKNDICFINSQTGYICGGVIDLQGIILKTTNAGANWNSLCISPEPMHEIQYIGGNNLYVMGGDYDLGSMLIRSTNLGNNWVYDTTGCFGNAKGFDFRTPSEVWAALTFPLTFAVNTDSMKPGSVWQCIPTPDNTEMQDVEFASPTKGWAVGSLGRIYKYNVNIISVSSNNGNLPESYELYQNYPNPFNPSTIINYSLPVESTVKITVYNAAGILIKTYNEGLRKAGRYSIEFKAADFPSGVYFYKMQAGSFSKSKKMVLIK
jgi:photosystem II stability/assembly factor-like uncharacterized protein